ncbi:MULTISPECIES: ribonuclease Z [unclassified Paenibacillus]|uniref:ribonuclease Z n=1 Tax=unclassified Paenibacillus TaxID=185978 RepID=UPI000930D65C|nr:MULTISPECIES: ribonuclease Z [unclassified Paenibacillus]
MEIYFLGTGAGMPSKERNVTSIMLNLLAERNAYWMFDCGEGTQHQILRAPVKISKLEKLFITHLHGDHIYGLPGLMSSRSYQGGDTPFTIYGPRGIREFIETSLRISDSHLGYETHIVEMEEESSGLLFEDNQVRVEYAPLVHRIASFGFRITEKDQPGKLLTDRLRELGVEAGPQYGRIKKGQPAVLADGREIAASEFLGPPVPGRIITILGDTQPCDNAVALASQADLLVHEATFAEARKEMAIRYDHSTAMDAARTAQQAGVGTLIMTHISSRYQEHAADELLREAQSIHPQTYLAADHFRLDIPLRGGRGH